MQAVLLSEPGGPELLRLQEVPTPEPGLGQAVVELRAAALNHRDLRIRRGTQPMPLPFIPGSDGAGVVSRVGPGVDPALVGQEVVINPGLSDDACDPCRLGQHSLCESFQILGGPGNGTYAQYVAVPAANLHPRPARLSWEESAAFPLAALTAWRMVISRAQLRPGETVLVLGAGSGVSTFAIQFARVAGAQVYVTSSSDAKLARARELGAVGGVNYQHEDWASKLLELNGGRGVDVVVDSVGAATWAGVLQVIRRGGRIVNCGSTGGAETTLNFSHFLRRQISLLGSYMGSKGEFSQVLPLLERGLVRPLVDRVFPLEQTAEAHAYLESGAQMGKVVLAVPR